MSLLKTERTRVCEIWCANTGLLHWKFKSVARAQSWGKFPENKAGRDCTNEEAPGLEIALLFQRTWVWHLAPTWWLTTFCNSKPRDPMLSSGLCRYRNEWDSRTCMQVKQPCMWHENKQIWSKGGRTFPECRRVLTFTWKEHGALWDREEHGSTSLQSQQLSALGAWGRKLSQACLKNIIHK